MVPGTNINFGDLTRPATVLIEKISEAIGGIFRPHQIRRIAEAEAEASRIKAVSEIEITDLQRRAIQRFFSEEAKKQQNIESITAMALPQLAEHASPETIEDDWITNFFDKCRLISDQDMQTLWSRLLSGEANSPGRFSKRTINVLSSLDKSDAELFRSLCSFGWDIAEIVPLVFNTNETYYAQSGIDFSALKHLDQIGLLSHEPVGGYRLNSLPQVIRSWYYGAEVEIKFKRPEENSLQIGTVLLSKAGHELAPVCGSVPVPGFREYVVGIWKSIGLEVNDRTAGTANI